MSSREGVKELKELVLKSGADIHLLFPARLTSAPLFQLLIKSSGDLRILQRCSETFGNPCDSPSAPHFQHLGSRAGPPSGSLFPLLPPDRDHK